MIAIATKTRKTPIVPDLGKRIEISHLDRKEHVPLTWKRAISNRNVLRLLLMAIVIIYMISLMTLFNPGSDKATGNVVALKASPVKASLGLLTPLVLSGIALFVLSRKEPDYS